MERVSHVARKSSETFVNVARKYAREIALVLVVVGAVNWGFHAAFDKDLLKMLEELVEDTPVIGGKFAEIFVKVIYFIVAAAGVFILYERFDKNQSLCL
jgi:uncharacterized membrane protein YuzA (DUF378 family)